MFTRESFWGSKRHCFRNMSGGGRTDLAFVFGTDNQISFIFLMVSCEKAI